MVIGWGGARAHSNDLRRVLPALAGVMDRHPEVVFAVMGDPAVQPLLAGLPAERVSFIAWGPLRDYYRFLEGVDIGLAPLSPSPYDRCRSDIRFVEYAAHGVLAICAELDPYRDVVRPGQTGYLYRDVTELETVLERALAEGEVRAAIPARAARYVASERLETGARPGAARVLSRGRRPDRDDAGRGGAAAASVPASRARRRARRPAHLRRLPLPGARPGGGRSPAGGGGGPQADRSGRRGPPLLRRRGPAGAAQPPAAALARHGPRSPADAVEALARAEAMNPLSCHAPYLRGVRLLELGDETATPSPRSSARGALAPGFGAPQERLGELCEAAGRIDDACRLYEEAALQNSGFALPIARLATLAMRDGKIDKAVGLLERTLANDPDLSLTNSLLGRAYVELKRFHQARVHLTARARRRRRPCRGARGARQRPRPGSATTTPPGRRSRRRGRRRLSDGGGGARRSRAGGRA